MGMRLHYEKKHVIKYGDSVFGNYNQSEIASLLCEYDVQMFSDEDEDTSYANNFYCPREEIKSLVKELRAKPADERIEPDNDDFDYTYGQVADFFEEALTKGEKREEYIYFSWF